MISKLVCTYRRLLTYMMPPVHGDGPSPLIRPWNNSAVASAAAQQDESRHAG
jgi:hypothetical protein